MTSPFPGTTLFRSLRLELQWSSCRKARSGWKVVIVWTTSWNLHDSFWGRQTGFHGKCSRAAASSRQLQIPSTQFLQADATLFVTGAMTYHTSLKPQLDRLVEQSIVPKLVSRLGRPLLRVGWLSMLWLRSTWSQALLNMFADRVRSHNVVAVFCTAVTFSISLWTNWLNFLNLPTRESCQTMRQSTWKSLSSKRGRRRELLCGFRTCNSLLGQTYMCVYI